MESWTNLTEGQGLVLSGFLTGLGAIIAVLLAQSFFRSKVSDLKAAILETEEAVIAFQNEIVARFKDFEESFKEIDITIAALQETAAKTQASIREQESDDEGLSEEVKEPHDPKERTFAKWYEISDHLEEIASSPNIDGRTRARYGRIDRRSYYDLIDALDYDGRLGNMRDIADEATELWYSCRRRDDIDEEASRRMSDYALKIKGIPMP
ncbi:hypothetical protein [Sphingorhabdus sp. YGSMI21]|uniref:hypothetical protein n=1 Tax=Sphingorhabdus sp. YGSMI21 TaxID=2077182 RepID=UPI000C1E4D0D|nr:hypothetical protein [Sphingorhabdus sp. YGSMI21]ATW02654.1 hypothetical protein CHN51_03285 [Sphingorhabdus sp. YGSMI21]